uniref:Uncharacterized protein n=1 Tax=Strix occidentalis caurina TaxID=311401 RepID=A0A8D0FLD5_STROC
TWVIPAENVYCSSQHRTALSNINFFKAAVQSSPLSPGKPSIPLMPGGPVTPGKPFGPAAPGAPDFPVRPGLKPPCFMMHPLPVDQNMHQLFFSLLFCYYKCCS